MIRKILILAALLAITACSATNVLPANDCPREGGIGGTGSCSDERVIA